MKRILILIVIVGLLLTACSVNDSEVEGCLDACYDLFSPSYCFNDTLVRVCSVDLVDKETKSKCFDRCVPGIRMID